MTVDEMKVVEGLILKKKDSRTGVLEKVYLQKLQRIYLKYNEKTSKSCLCSPVVRRIWQASFFWWYDALKNG